LTIEHCSLPQLLDRFDESKIFLCEDPKNAQAKKLSDIQITSPAVFLIGGFQHGEANMNVLKMRDFFPIYLYKEIKPAWIIAAKLVTWLELRNQLW
jgi:rRNA pseudouridine-1189 N-methylase Emg1 (Nep1/Mra1 family)